MLGLVRKIKYKDLSNKFDKVINNLTGSMVVDHTCNEERIMAEIRLAQQDSIRKASDTAILRYLKENEHVPVNFIKKAGETSRVIALLCSVFSSCVGFIPPTSELYKFAGLLDDLTGLPDDEVLKTLVLHNTVSHLSMRKKIFHQIYELKAQYTNLEIDD